MANNTFNTLFPNVHGFRVRVNGLDLTQGWNAAQVRDVMYAVTADPVSDALIIESCSGREADCILNPGNMILEALTTQFEKLDKTIAKVGGLINGALAGRKSAMIETVDNPSGLTIDTENIFLGPVRKNNLFAYRTATFSVSDGQTVSILFHSPDSDPMVLEAGETLIAYRWMLNKADITPAVAPEGGKDITAGQMASRLAKLIVANSAKFTASANNRAENAAQLQEVEAKRAELLDRSVVSTSEIQKLEEDLVSIADRAGKVTENLTRERERNARLKEAKAAKQTIGWSKKQSDVMAALKSFGWQGSDSRLEMITPAGVAGVAYTKQGDYSRVYLGNKDGQQVTLGLFNFSKSDLGSSVLMSDTANASGIASTINKLAKSNAEYLRLNNKGGIELRLEEMGGKDWNGKRYYFNDWHQYSSLKIERNKSGSLNTVEFDGEKISNSKAEKMLSGKVYYDIEKKVFVAEGFKISDAVDEALVKMRATLESKNSPESVPVTPPVEPSGVDYNFMVKIAADSIDKLRSVDVERVLEQNLAEHRLGLAGYIKQNRPDLSSEVDDVMNYLNGVKPPKQTTPRDPRTRYAAALLPELEAAGFTANESFERNNPDYVADSHSYLADKKVQIGRQTVFVKSVEGGKAEIYAGMTYDVTSYRPSDSKLFSFSIPAGILEGVFDDVISTLTEWFSQFETGFDSVDFPAFGSKYNQVKSLSMKDINALIRKDIAAMMPSDMKGTSISVASDGGRSSSTNITVKSLPSGVDMYAPLNSWDKDDRGEQKYRLSPKAEALRKMLEAIANSYRYDKSDSMTDYFDTNFYAFVYFDSNLEKTEREKAQAMSEEQANKNDKKEYRYAMVNRPVGIGTIPDGIIRTEARPPIGSKHYDSARNGIAIYNRKLTDLETKQYEMAPIVDGDDISEYVDIVSKSLNEYANQYLDMYKKDKVSFRTTVFYALKNNINGYYPSIGDEDNFLIMVKDKLAESVSQQPSFPEEFRAVLNEKDRREAARVYRDILTRAIAAGFDAENDPDRKVAEAHLITLAKKALAEKV